MENGKWKMENGELKIKNDVLRMNPLSPKKSVELLNLNDYIAPS